MVTKRAAGPPLATNNASNDAKLPYPTTPIDSSKIPASTKSIYSPDLNTSPAFDLIDMDQARNRPRRDSDVSSHGTWDSDGDEDEESQEPSKAVEIPQPLRITPSKQNLNEQPQGNQQAEMPAILRPGPPNGVAAFKRKPTQAVQQQTESQANPWAENGQNAAQEPGRRFESNNPWHIAQTAEASGVPVTSYDTPTHIPPPPPSNAPPAPPVELPTNSTPVGEIANLSLTRNQNEAQRRPYETAEVLHVPPKGQAPLQPVSDQDTTSEVTTNPWAQGMQEPTAEEKWNDHVPPSAVVTQSVSHKEQTPPSPKRIPEVSELPRREQRVLAPISTQQAAPSQSISPAPETPGTVAKRQRSEHYQIKHINWYDTSSPSGQSQGSAMRHSPVLMQNANGPCPLLALVNTLVLTTPPNENTALIETLRSREQVSLGLLLDAVFDELISGRRGETATALPDVGELYSFLLALHTGMNVNPRFITPVSTPRGSLDGHPPDMNTVHPIHRAQSKAGCFEETKEMRLYSTFSVPLIHGWIPPTGTQAYHAFERSAQSFEDAQNIQFAELELEDKLRNGGLSAGEQQTLQDVQTIKHFLTTWPTQLTDYGLQAIVSSLRAGQFAILFRNDHFSTVYKEPRNGSLMTLVTDTGYSSHDEIVWESLVDVNGAASELFSGDFRVVSHNQDAHLNQGSSAGGGEEGWQTVQNRNRPHEQNNRTQAGRAADDDVPPPLPGPRPVAQSGVNLDDSLGVIPEVQRTRSEQEDHDLALALQLQEEEEAQQRQDEERRQREQHLSEQLLSRESEGRPPAIPPRRGGSRQSTSTRPAVTRPPNDSPDAPPTYEQSASDRPYREAGSGARPSQGNPLNAYDALRRQSAYAEQGTNNSPQAGSQPFANTNQGRPSMGGRMRRHSQLPGSFQSGGPSQPQGRRPGQAATAEEAEDKCVVM